MEKEKNEKETWNWLKKADLKDETEVILCRARTGNLNKLCETHNR